MGAWQAQFSPGKFKVAQHREELRRLKAGTTQEEIRRLFDPPQDVHDLYGNHHWCYYRSNGTTIVYVILDTNFLYQDYEVDD